MAYGVTAAAIFLSVSGAVDDDLSDDPMQFLTYGYTGLTVVPLILFGF